MVYSEMKVKLEATIFYQCFFISKVFSVSHTTSHTQRLLSFGKVVLLRKVVHHNVRGGQRMPIY